MRSLEYQIMKDPEIVQSFGVHPNGEDVFCYTIRNKNGLEMNVLNFGANIQSLKVPIANGNKVDVVLGFDSFHQYLASFQLPAPPYLGALVGRFAGRINQAVFAIGQETFSLPRNHGKHHIHGGNQSFSLVMWELIHLTDQEITLCYNSKDLEENYPGDLKTTLTYSLTDDNELKVNISAISSRDTLVNLTQHSYFNLDGHSESIGDQLISIQSEEILEIDSENIPTGNFIELKDHPFDFSTPKACPQKIDHTFVLNSNRPNQAVLISQKNKLKMVVSTNQPAIHVYVGGNCFNQIAGKNGANYHPLSGICFEAQNFPDAPNHPNFPSATLKKGDVYHHQTMFKFESLK